MKKLLTLLLIVISLTCYGQRYISGGVVTPLVKTDLFQGFKSDSIEIDGKMYYVVPPTLTKGGDIVHKNHLDAALAGASLDSTNFWRTKSNFDLFNGQGAPFNRLRANILADRFEFFIPLGGGSFNVVDETNFGGLNIDPGGNFSISDGSGNRISSNGSSAMSIESPDSIRLEGKAFYAAGDIPTLNNDGQLLTYGQANNNYWLRSGNFSNLTAQTITLMQGTLFTTGIPSGSGFFDMAITNLFGNEGVGVLSDGRIGLLSIDGGGDGVGIIGSNDGLGGLLIRDTRSTTTGLIYENDYSADFIDRSLIDRGYVDSNLGGNPLSSIAQSPGASEDGKVLAWDNTASVWDTVTVSGGGGVTSVFGRTDAVTAQSGDYSADQITNAIDLNTQTNTITYEANPWSLNHSGNNVFQFVKSAGTGGMNFTNSSTSTGSVSVVRQSSGAGSVVIANDNTGGGDVEIRRSDDSAGDVILRAQGSGNEVLIYQSTDIDNLSDSAGVNKKGLADYVSQAIDTLKSSSIIREEIINLGVWNMSNATGSLSLAVDVTSLGIPADTAIISVEVSIIHDEGAASYQFLDRLDVAGSCTVCGSVDPFSSATTITINNEGGGFFDSTTFDRTDKNRGYMIVKWREE